MDRLVTDKTALALRIFDVIDSIEEQLTTIQQQLQEVRELVDTLATEESTDQEEEEEEDSSEDTGTVEEDISKPSARLVEAQQDTQIEPRTTTKKQSREDARQRAQQWARTLSSTQLMPRKTAAQTQVRK
jgi:regulator of replication initiation timing